MTDRELIERYGRGEGRDEAFRMMAERYAGMVGSEWKLDMDRSFHVNVDLGRMPAVSAEQAEERDVATVLAFAKTLDDVAGRVESGELESIIATKWAVQAGVAKVMRENGLVALNFDTLLMGESEK